MTFSGEFFSLIHFIFVVQLAARVEINEDNLLLQIEAMTIVCLEVFLLLFVYPLAAHTEDERSSFFSVRRNAAFWGNDGILRSEKTAGLMSCARLCSKEALCSVANFDEKRQLCLLVKESPDDKSGKHWEEQKDFSGLEKVSWPVHFLKQS